MPEGTLGARGFFLFCFAAKVSGEAAIVNERKKTPLVTAGMNLHANSRQDSLPKRFYVGSVCFRNLTCLRVDCEQSLVCCEESTNGKLRSQDERAAKPG